MHQHRCWVNAKLLSAASELSVEQLRAPFEIGQGSVWQTLLHLMGAEYVWLETVLGNESPVMPGDLPDELVGNQLAEDSVRSFEDLRARWSELDARWETFLSELQPIDLAKQIFKVSTSSVGGQRRATSLMDILLHVCTHAHYTSAQLINMLRQLGSSELPDPMMITMAREGT
ncbi:DinB family protein [Roseiconus nitratireducens]|nr:DinB family protein [Roseiconus nitratireducens]